jgi:hypothetical protein
MVGASPGSKGGSEVVEGVFQQRSNDDERRLAIGDNFGELLQHGERERRG